MLSTETIHFDEEIARLEERLDVLVEREQELKEDATDYDDVLAEGMDIDTVYLPGLEWAREEYDDETVTIGELGTGEYAQLMDKVREAAAQQVGQQPATDGVELVFWSAIGLVDAPFLNGDETFEQRAAVIRNVHPQFTKWLKFRVEDATTVSRETGNSFVQRVKANQSPSGHSSNSPDA